MEKQELDLLRIAVVQVQSNNIPEENYQKAVSFMKQASGKADIIAFPEAFLVFHNKYALLAEKISEHKYIQRFCKMAKEYNLAVVLGGLPEASVSSDKFWNTLVFISNNGEVKVTYRKKHLCILNLPSCRIDEKKVTLGGKEIVSCNYKGIGLGFSICHDLRFPDFFSTLKQQGAHVIFVPSAFAYETGKMHWHTLLKARAIEQQVYIIAPNHSGQYNQRSFYGHSVAYSPWGEKLDEIKEGEGMFIVSVDKKYIMQIRAYFE